MSCIAPERFVELLEAEGLASATPNEGSHLASCGDCREAWAGLAGADRLMHDAPVPAPQRTFPWIALAAAAAVLVAVGVALWDTSSPPAQVLGRPQDPSKVEPAPVVAEVVIEKTSPAPAPDGPKHVVAVTVQILELPAGPVGKCRWWKSGDPTEVMPPGKSVSKPRLTVFDGQLSHILQVQDFGYIKGYDLEFSADGATSTPTPVIDRVRIGFGIEVRPEVVDAAAGSVRLAPFEIHLWDRAPEMRKIATALGEIQDPGVVSMRVPVTATLAKGESLTIGPLKGPLETSPARMYYVSCEILPSDAALKQGERPRDFPLDAEPVARIFGKVTAVHNDAGLVVISAGSSDGVADGQDFELRRAGRVIAKVRASEVNATWSAGKILAGAGSEEPRVGDDVWSATSK